MEWFPTRGKREEGREDRSYDAIFPAEAPPLLAISDHFPAMLPIPWTRSHAVKTGKRLVIHELTQDVWARRNADGLLPKGGDDEVEPISLD